MGCGMSMVKYLLFIFNAVFALGGLAILVVGALLYANVEKADFIMEKVDAVNFSASPITLIAVGSIIFVIAFFGCCGAIRESHCMIVTFAVFLLALLLIQIAIGIFLFVMIQREGWEQVVHESIEESFANYHNSTIVQEKVDNLQRNLECCGVDGSDYWARTGRPIPDSCCQTPPCTNLTAESQAFDQGCAEALKELLITYGIVLGALAIAVGVIEIIGIVCALCLANSIRNSERRGTV